ncbi:methionine ABC transporter ATP-binding protein [Chondromyces crocatus]|uniref:Cell division ATP-binding protein FtsE n=1 Tax=Chondromyces crocatus TaxID=52 RepID=A0A0K1E9T5_CHOCO|nr:ATP-binding cassette domain-containing protein [Chondromyces crocatus]AKT37599.1 ABC transporter ATP-binding protein [Chondromyces crocatus]
MSTRAAGAELSFERVSKRYQAGNVAIDALTDLSLTVRRGTIQAVIGASGAGKSTLFRCAATLERPDTGHITLNGLDLASLNGPALREARRAIGTIFQQLHLLPSRTAADNVGFPLELAGADRSTRDARVRELLGWVGLSARGDSYPSALSGGQRQRVAIARALATSPGLLLCDEPTSALDTETTNTVLDLLRRARDELGVTVLLITHDLRAVQRICDRVARLEAGRLATEGPVTDVLATSPPETRTSAANEAP